MQENRSFCVIDLGTNTFHIIIGYIDQTEKIQILKRERRYVYLGKGGVQRITESSFQKGIDTLIDFKSIMHKFNVVDYRAIGTAALRSASNAQQFLKQAQLKAGIHIEVIDGDQEADYIYKGTLLAKSADTHTHMIMDIGGGSVEFIIFNHQEKLWFHSFNIGISILHPKFQINDPLSDSDKSAIQSHLDQQLSRLYKVLDAYHIHSLIGASGTFEVMVALLDHHQSKLCKEINLDDFKVLYDDIMSRNLEERLAIKNLDPNRAELIQIALYLVKHILNIAKPKHLLVSPFALKEGVLSDLSEQG